MQSQGNLEERELVNRLNKGDELALASIYENYWEMMYLAAYNLVKNAAVSEDIVQDVFVKLWHKRHDLEIKISLKSYLYTSTVYKTYDFFRKNKSAVTMDLVEGFNEQLQTSNPETELMDKELHAYLDTVIDGFPEKCRQVFQLSRNEQLSNKEIALRLDISIRTVEGHINKALNILRAAISSISTTSFVVFLLHYLNK